MDTIFSVVGLVGAACAVGMFAAVALGKISAERPVFYGVNAVGAVFVLAAASREFDIGDLGTMGQELAWAILSFVGLIRACKKRDAPGELQVQLPLHVPYAPHAPYAPRATFGLRNAARQAA